MASTIGPIPMTHTCDNCGGRYIVVGTYIVGGHRCPRPSDRR